MARANILYVGTFVLFSLLSAGCSKEAKLKKAVGSADEYFASGEYEKAKISYLSVLRSDGQNAHAIKQIGMIWSEQGAPLAAIPFLKKASELAPADTALRLKFAQALLTLGQVNDARKEAMVVLDANPGHAEALLLLAKSSLNEEAIAETGKRLEAAPDSDEADLLLARATLSFRRGDRTTGLAFLNKALEKHPDSASAHFAQAELYLSDKELEKAEETLQKASDLAPARSPIRLALPQYYIQTGKVEKAEEYLESFVKTAPDYLPAILLQALLASQKQDFKRAADLLEKVFQTDSSNVDARLLQGKVFLATSEADKAVDILKQVTDSFPGIPVAKFDLARAYLASGNSTLATASLVDAIQLQPEYVEALLLLGQLKLQAGEPQTVVDSMTTLLRKRPNMLPAQLLLSQAYRSLGNLVEAARVLTEQIEAAPDAPEPHLLLGLVYLQDKKPAEARTEFETVRKLAPKNLLASFHLIELDLAEKKFDAARGRAEALVKEMPEAAGAHYLMARVETAQERWKPAEAALKKSIELDSNFIAAYDMLVNNYVRNGELEKARDETASFVAGNPENVGGLITLAAIREHTGDSDGARESYQKVIERDPNSVTALNNLAVILAKDPAQLDKAYELASRARTLAPDNAAIADTLGWISYQRKDYRQAVALLEEAAGKLSDNSVVQYHLGMANYMAGNANAARTALTKAAAAEGEFPGKEEIAPALTMLGDGSGTGPEMSNEQLQAALKERPADLVARQKLAERLEKAGDFAQAGALWEEAVRQNPNLLIANLKLAELNAGPLKNPEAALDYAKKARAIAPNDPEVIRLAGRAAYLSGNYPWAYTLLQNTARAANPAPDVLHDLALSAYSLGKVDEAREAMQKALDAAPDGPQAESEKRFLKFTADGGNPNAPAASDAEAEAALKEDPQFVPALMFQAASHTQAGRRDEAIAIHQKVLGRFPDFGPAQKRLAALYLDQPGKADATFELATKARQNLPKDPEVAQILATVRYQRKEYASAVQLFEESAKVRELDADSLFYLGMSQLNLKKAGEGLPTLKKALADGLTGTRAEEARRVIAEKEEPPAEDKL